jgi:O-antigen/teichoic acid export membrane protein
MVGLGTFQALGMVFMLARSKVVAMSVGPAGLGAIGVVDQFVLFTVQLCAFSVPFTATKFLSSAHSEGGEAFGRLYTAYLRLVLLLSALGTVVVLVVIGLWPSLLARELATYGSLVVVALLAIAPINVAALVQNALASSRRLGASATLGLISTVVLCTFTAIGTAAYGVTGYYFSTLVALSAAAVGGVLYLHRAERIPAVALSNPFTELRRYRTAVRSALALYVASLTAPASELIARYAVVRAGTLVTAGLLQASLGIALTLRTFIRPSFSLFLVPVLNRRSTPEEKLRSAALFSRAMCAIAGAVSVAAALFPAQLLSILYTGRFSEAAPFVYLFMLAINIQQLGAINLALVFSLDDLKLYLASLIVGDVVSCLVSWLFVPRFGIPAIAAALILDGVIVFSWTAAALWRKRRLNIVRHVGLLPVAVLVLTAGLGRFAPLQTSMTASAVLRGAIIWAIACAFFALQLRSGLASADERRHP